MGITFAVLFGLVVIYTGVAFAIGVLASQCMVTIQGTDAGDRLKQAVTTTKPSAFVPSLMGDNHPMDTRVWLALRQARNLPEAVQRKARVIGWLYNAERLVFGGLFVVVLLHFIVRR